MADLYRLGHSVEKSIDSVGEEIRIDLGLAPNPQTETGQITGEVVDEYDEPIEGALIKVLDSSNTPLYHTLTDESGRYVLDGISPRREIKIGCVKNRYRLKESTPFSISAGQSLNFDFSLDADLVTRMATIAGDVFDTNGDPIEFLNVTLMEKVGATETEYAKSVTNEYGQYAFVAVETGEYKIILSGDGYRTVEIDVTITTAGKITKIESTVPYAPVSLNGTVNGIIYDDKGNGVVGACVVLYEVTGTDDNPIYTAKRYTKTIQSGAYLFGDVPQGNYIVKANKLA